MALAAGMMMTVAGCSTSPTCSTIAFAGSPSDAAATASGPAPGTGPVLVPGTTKAPVTTALTVPLESTITLVTGEQILVHRAQGSTITAAPAQHSEGPGGGFVKLTWAGDQFMIPYEAVPYLGTLLDPRLFDISYLARSGDWDARSHAEPVTVSGAPSAAVLPGLHLTGQSAGAISKSQAARFGDLLFSLWRSGGHDAALARTGLITPAGPSLPAPLPLQLPAIQGSGGNSPAFHTVTMNFTDLHGKPGAGIGWLQNLNDAALSEFVLSAGGTPGAVQGTAGPVKASVAAGNYSMQMTVLTPRPGVVSVVGADAALVVKPDVAVNSDVSESFDARTATPFHATVTGGMAAKARVDWLGLTRISVAGGGCSGFGMTMALVSASGVEGSSASTLLATPVSSIGQGGLDFDAGTGIDTSAPAPLTTTPRYYLDFPTEGGIPKSLTYSVPLSHFTTVRQNIRNVPGAVTGACPLELWPVVFMRWGQVVSMEASPNDEVPPGVHTDYWYSSSPALDAWQPRAIGQNCDGLYDQPRVLANGSTLTETWADGPMVPSPAGPPAYFAMSTVPQDPAVTLPAADREANIGLVNLQPYGDSEPSHFGGQVGGDSSIPTSVNFYRNGTIALSSYVSKTGLLVPFGLLLPMLPAQATYRLDWKLDRPTDSIAYNDTDWTFRSGPADKATRLPGTEPCTPDPSRACSFLPLLFVNYQLGLNNLSQAVAGKPFQIAFIVSHQLGEPAPNGLTATVSASFNDGKTWTAARAAHATGAGKFVLNLTQPALSATTGFVSLRVIARDGAGNSVTQTIIRAYQLIG